LAGYNSEDEAVRLMVQHACVITGGCTRTGECELAQRLMSIARTLGFGPEDLQPIVRAGAKACGLVRDAVHVVSVDQVWNRDSSQTHLCLTVLTMGQFAGVWAFMLTDGGALMIAHDSRPCTELDGLEGAALMEAVIRSALTEPLELAAPTVTPSWLERLMCWLRS
jgi:hypothetical protein